PASTTRTVLLPGLPAPLRSAAGSRDTDPAWTGTTTASPASRRYDRPTILRVATHCLTPRPGAEQLGSAGAFRDLVPDSRNGVRSGRLRADDGGAAGRRRVCGGLRRAGPRHLPEGAPGGSPPGGG